jgi:hypothetical protein
MANPPARAVITADIVNFTKLDKKEQKKLLTGISSISKANTLEFYRGDSFQVFLEQAADALDYLVLLRSAAKKLIPGQAIPIADIRSVIAIGPVKMPVKQLSTTSGEAFTLSGRSFDTLKEPQRLIILSVNEAVNPALRVISLFIDYLFDHLTARQAEVIFELMKESTQTEVAKILRKSQATINQHVQSSGWPEIKKLLKEYQNLVSNTA